MAVFVNDIGRTAWLASALGNAGITSTTIFLDLYVDDLFVPGLADTIATYAAIGFVVGPYDGGVDVSSTWTVSSTGGVAKIELDPVTFTIDADTAPSGGETIYGYYVFDATSGAVLWSEPLAAPVFIDFVTGGSITVNPALMLRNQ
jgi:hypothetical protein